MYKQYTMELAGRTLRVDIGRVCAQANGASLMHYGDTVVLSTATASKEPREGIDFFPLSVEYEEKMYSVGKIPGGFNKREGKASENAILTSRVIDRPMRPLFPKDYRNDVTLNNMVMSVDTECRPELLAMLGSALSHLFQIFHLTDHVQLHRLVLLMVNLLLIHHRSSGQKVIYSLQLHLQARKLS